MTMLPDGQAAWVYVVIFRATCAELDDTYHATAERLQALARSEYGCLDFVSVSQGDEEISLSYWRDLDQIEAWRNDPQHRAAQARGKDKWYRSYHVEICKRAVAHTAGAQTGTENCKPASPEE